MTIDDVAVGELSTPVGQVAVAATHDGLAAVGWCSPAALAGRCGAPVTTDEGRVAPVLAQLAAYFRGERRGFDLPIDWRFTAAGSQRDVLQALHARIGFGTSTTYGELAVLSGTGVPARGIGAIMGSNPIPIVVPCHRVLAHDGLGGYSGGSGRDSLEVKRWLLALEGVLPPTLDWTGPS